MTGLQLGAEGGTNKEREVVRVRLGGAKRLCVTPDAWCCNREPGDGCASLSRRSPPFCGHVSIQTSRGRGRGGGGRAEQNQIPLCFRRLTIGDGFEISFLRCHVLNLNSNACIHAVEQGVRPKESAIYNTRASATILGNMKHARETGQREATRKANGRYHAIYIGS